MLPKVFYRFDGIPIKIPKAILAEIERNTLKFIKNQGKGIQESLPTVEIEEVGGYTVFRRKTHYKASVITSV